MRQWFETLIPKLDRSIIEVNCFELKYSGHMAGSDFFISTNSTNHAHPLELYMQENEYLRTLAAADAKCVQETISGTFLTELPRSKVLNLGSFQAYVQPEIKLPGTSFPYQAPALVDSTFAGGVREWTPILNATHASFGPAEVFNRTSYPFRCVNNGAKPTRGIEAAATEIHAAYPLSTETNEWFPELSHSLSMVGALSNEAAVHLGVSMRFNPYPGAGNPDYGDRWTPTSGALQQLVGYRRWFVAVMVANGLLFVGGYLIGEGEDVFYSHFGGSWMGGSNRDYLSAIQYADKPRRVTFDGQHSTANTAIVASDKFKAIWPLSFSHLFVNSVKLSDVVISTAEPVEFDDRVVIDNIIDAKVDRVDGSLLFADYAKYLDGLGIYEPYTEEEKAKVASSWAKLPDGIVFALKTEQCANRSVKETTAYKEYGRKRAKACKDNNFLDLPYNDEYTWKQVDNMMSALKSRSIWITDAGNAEIISAPPVTTTPVTRTLTFSVNTSNVLNWVSDEDAVRGQLILSTSSFESLLDRMMPFRIVDTATGDMNTFLASNNLGSVQDFNGNYNVETYKEIHLGMGVRAIGAAVTYEDIVAVNGVDGEISYLASQLTDYRHFNGKLALLVSSLQGHMVYPKLVDKFVLSP